LSYTNISKTKINFQKKKTPRGIIPNTLQQLHFTPLDKKIIKTLTREKVCRYQRGNKKP